MLNSQLIFIHDELGETLLESLQGDFRHQGMKINVTQTPMSKARGVRRSTVSSALTKSPTILGDFQQRSIVTPNQRVDVISAIIRRRLDEDLGEDLEDDVTGGEEAS